jgi:hypothetical protein
MSQFFSEREVRLARSFIKAIHGNEKNGYLLLAVIAWQRAMTKSHDSFWKTLTKYTAFRAGQLLAAKLLARSRIAPNQYKGLLATLKRAPGAQAGQVTQARDFMLVIEQSSWDKDHYGYKPYAEGHWQDVISYGPHGAYQVHTVWVPEQQEVDPLAIIWSKLTGHNIPKQYFIDKVTMATPKPRPEPPRQPRSLVHVLPQPDYIGPYSARSFYEARPHLGDNVLPE